MKERIIEFLRAENKSSVKFAEEIGVQPSGISHILSGRNNPSLDFVLKMLERYKFLSSDWLLFGKGAMYKDSGGMQSLFDQSLFDQKSEQSNESVAKDEPEADFTIANTAPGTNQTNAKKPDHGISETERIVWFYTDGTFTEFHPRRT